MFEVTVSLSEQTVCDLLITAFEGGSNYWVEETSELPWKDKDSSAFDQILNLPIEIKEQDEDEPKILTIEKIRQGIQLMANQNPFHFADIVCENFDAETADVFLQYCLLGEIVYG